MSTHVPISAAIPTYNRRRSLGLLLESLIPQLQPDDELIVLDDGSDDGTAEVLRAVKRVRFLRNDRNQGMVKAWNSCLASASHNWVCIVHDDDVVAPDALATIRRALSVVPAPALIAHRLVDPDLDATFRYRIAEPGPWAVLNSMQVPSGVVVHKAMVESVGAFDERFRYSADLEYFARLCARYPLVIVESPPVVYYRLHGSNYQYKTWRAPDFLTQLEEIERCVVAYAALSGDKATAMFEHRMIGHCTHMLRAAAHAEDPTLLRTIGRALVPRSYLGHRIRLIAWFAALLNGYPQFLWTIKRRNPSL